MFIFMDGCGRRIVCLMCYPSNWEARTVWVLSLLTLATSQRSQKNSKKHCKNVTQMPNKFLTIIRSENISESGNYYDFS